MSVFVISLVVTIGILSTGTASAHTRLITTEPDAGAELATAPDAISLAFNEGVLKLGAAVQVTGPDGTTTTGPAKVKDKKVSWTLPADLPNGRYTVIWRVAALDGHPINDTFSFVLKAAGSTGSPSATGADPTSGPTPVVTSHTAIPEMTGPMPGMEGMPGMAEPTQSTGASLPTGLAIAGLALLMVMVVGAIVIERRRRPPASAADRSGPSTD